MPKLIHLSCFLYARLLVFYPRDLREKFGAHMVEIFEDMLRDLPPPRSVATFLAVWRTALWELASVGLMSRLQETFVIATAASVVLTSLLTWLFFRVLRA